MLSDDARRQDGGFDRELDGSSAGDARSSAADHSPADHCFGPIVASAAVGPALAHVRERGGDTAGLIRKFHLPESVDRDALIFLPVGRIPAVMDAAADASATPFLGLKLAGRGLSPVLHLLEIACSGARLEHAIDRYVRYLRLVQERFTVASERERGRFVLRIGVAGWPEALGRHSNEHLVASVVNAARRITGATVTPVEVAFAHADDRSRAELERFLGTRRLTFGAGENSIVIREDILDLPIAAPAPNYLHLLELSSALLASFPGRNTSIRERVEDAVRAHLSTGTVSLEQVSRTLGRSTRSLQRDLAGMELSFQTLVDQVRHQLAEFYLRREALSVAQIALRLGYAQTGAFVRAFRRWTGSTPSALRRLGSGRG